MNINLDNLRRNMVQHMDALGHNLKSIFEDSERELTEEDLELFDVVAQEINVLSCVYDTDSKDFNDLSSEPKIKYIAVEDLQQLRK